MLLDTVSFFDTAPGSSGGAAAAVSGDSLTVKNAESGTPIRLVALCPKNQTAGWVQLVYPSGNDTTRNIRAAAPAAVVGNVLGRGMSTPLVESETITATIAGSGTAGDIEQAFMLIYYESLPGQSGRYISHDELTQRAVRMVTVEATITSVATGAYSAGEALNAESDLLLPHKDYAWIGGISNTLCNGFGMRGPDNANGRIMIPGDPDEADRTASFLADLAKEHGLPLIPIFNSDNKANISLFNVTDENSNNTQVVYNLVELAS